MASNESERGPVRSRKIDFVAVLVGVFLTALSFLPALSAGSERWTTEQAHEYQDASMRIQELTHELGSQSPDTVSKGTSVEFQDAIDHFQELRAKLDDARGRSGAWATALRVVGSMLVIAGVANYFAAKRKLRDRVVG